MPIVDENITIPEDPLDSFITIDAIIYKDMIILLYFFCLAVFVGPNGEIALFQLLKFFDLVTL